jgi:hypothetical protein
MKTPKSIFFSALLIIAGCQNPATQSSEQNHPDTISPKQTAKKPSTVLVGDSTIINNEFSKAILAFEVFKADTDKIKSLFLDPVTLKLEKLSNEEGDFYLLYNFSDGINKLSLFYNDGFYVKDGDIKNNLVRLNRSISIGMAKADFLKLINVRAIAKDTITVKDNELSYETVYIFNNAKLMQIETGNIVE